MVKALGRCEVTRGESVSKSHANSSLVCGGERRVNSFEREEGLGDMFKAHQGDAKGI